MSSSLFRVTEHVIPCSHLRQYPHATIDHEDQELHLAVKQYTPLDNPNPQPGDITILGAHANGFPKELYEPFWDSLLQQSKNSGFRIRHIFIADVAHQGYSGILNESKLGNDPSWYDHSRDLFNLVNHFRRDFIRPIIGIGHSMGGTNLINLSLMHPRLFTSLVLIDPSVARRTSQATNWLPTIASTGRRDRWPSRNAAEAVFRKSKFYQTWDPRVLSLWIQYGLRDLPTKLFDNIAESRPYEPVEKEVTLTTTKHQEVFTFARPTPKSSMLVDMGLPQRLTHPDFDPELDGNGPFYRPEPIRTFLNLPFLRPSVLYVFGETSAFSEPQAIRAKLENTGSSKDGSGGIAKGRVQHVMIQGAGHLVPMEKVDETGRHCAKWLSGEMRRWREDEEVDRRVWNRVPEREKFTINRKMIDVGGTNSGVGMKKNAKPNL
jgi:pimeloyl-ACP methyl ester carboxylesterase